MSDNISRRRLLSGAAAGALTVVGTGHVAGQSASTPTPEDGADGESRTLTIETDATVQYELVSGSPGDTATASGYVGSGTASVTFSGELRRFAAVGLEGEADPTIRLDGEEVDPRDVVETHTIVLQNDAESVSRSEYSLAVEADLNGSSAVGAAVNEGDAIDGNAVEGVVSGGRDAYTYAGGLVRFTGLDTTVYVDGKRRDPADLVDRHTITVVSSDDSYRRYELAVESGLEKSDALGASLNGDDTVDGTEASGAVTGGRDSYTYSGGLERFHGENVTVYVDGRVRDPFEFVETHTLTVESPDEGPIEVPEETIVIGPRYEYHSYELSVESDLEKSDALGASLNGDDTVDGTEASGAVSGGRDSYTYSGSLERFAAENVELLIDGRTRDARNLVDTHTLTVEPDRIGDFSVDYTLSVDADLQRDDALGATIDEDDVVDGTTATGTVTADRDSYTYTGSEVDVVFDGYGLPVALDGQFRPELTDIRAV